MEHISKNRQAILACLRATACHPTAAWIYDRLRTTCPHISLGTVYRNLCQLKEASLIRSIGVVAGEEHFDGNLSPHAHLICRRCGRIDDIAPPPGMAEWAEALQQKSGFTDAEPSVVGVCPDCRAATDQA